MLDCEEKNAELENTYERQYIEPVMSRVIQLAVSYSIYITYTSNKY